MSRKLSYEELLRRNDPVGIKHALTLKLREHCVDPLWHRQLMEMTDRDEIEFRVNNEYKHELQRVHDRYAWLRSEVLPPLKPERSVPLIPHHVRLNSDVSAERLG